MKEKTDKKEIILDVAEQLFAELGYDGASTRHIAKEAGVNISMLNYYFGGKEGLFLNVFERRVSSFRQYTENLNNTSIDPWQKIEKWIASYCDRITTHFYFQKIIYREITLAQRTDLSDALYEMLFKNINEIKKIITDGISKGSFNDVDVDMLIATIFGTKNFIVNTTYLSSRVTGADTSDPQVLKDIVRPRLYNHMVTLLKAYLIKQ